MRVCRSLYAASVKLEALLLKRGPSGIVEAVVAIPLKLDKQPAGLKAVAGLYTHTITTDSPLYGLDRDGFVRNVKGLSIYLTGDESKSYLTTHMGNSWSAEEVLFGYVFEPFWMPGGANGLGSIDAKLVHAVSLAPEPTQKRKPPPKNAPSAEDNWEAPSYMQGGATLFRRASVEENDSDEETTLPGFS